MCRQVDRLDKDKEAKMNVYSRANNLRKEINMRIWLVSLATSAKTNSFLLDKRST